MRKRREYPHDPSRVLMEVPPAKRLSAYEAQDVAFGHRTSSFNEVEHEARPIFHVGMKNPKSRVKTDRYGGQVAFGFEE